MKKAIVSVSVLALLVSCASAASAQCRFNATAKAKGMKASLVRMYAKCYTEAPEPGYGEYGLGVNTTTGGGRAACGPPEPARLSDHSTCPPFPVPWGCDDAWWMAPSPYHFDPVTGGGDVALRSVVEPDCSRLDDADGKPLGLPAGPCHVTYVKATCRGILDSNGLPITSSDHDEWDLSLLVRMSFDDGANGDMTIIDFPVTFLFEPPDHGRIHLESNTARALASILVDTSSAALPTCTNFQILKLTVKDPEGLPFATLGGSTR